MNNIGIYEKSRNKNLKKLLGPENWKTVGIINENYYKIGCLEHDIRFLEECISKKITPKGLNLNKTIKGGIRKSKIKKIENRIM